MSWLSSAIKRNSNVIQAIAKPLISHIPVVGSTISDRMLMSPTKAQENLSAATTVAAATSYAAVAPFVAPVAAEAPKPVAPALFTEPERAILPAPTPGTLTQKQLAIGGAALLVLVLLVVMVSNRK